MDILIDYKIKDWVFYPILVVMFMVGIFRFYLSQYTSLTSTGEKVKSKKQVQDSADNNIIAKCEKLIANNSFISENSFKMRRSYLCKKQTGLLYKHSNDKPADPMSGMMLNNNMVTDMLKNNLSYGVTAMLQFGWISHFFSGFIIGKVPFPLTQKFRGFLQQGVHIENLDVRYVSSISLYFLLLFGLSGLQSLILGADKDSAEMREINDISKMQQMNMMPGQMPGQAADYNKLFNSQRENVELIKHSFLLENCEDTLIQKMKKIKETIERK